MYIFDPLPAERPLLKRGRCVGCSGPREECGPDGKYRDVPTGTMLTPAEGKLLYDSPLRFDQNGVYNRGFCTFQVTPSNVTVRYYEVHNGSEVLLFTESF